MNITPKQAEAAEHLLITSMKVVEGRLAKFVIHKKIESYGRSLRAATRGLWKGTLDRFSFMDSVLSAMQREFERAWREGARACGIGPDERTQEEQDKLNQIVSEQSQHIPGLADWIMAHSKFWLDELFVAPEIQQLTPSEPLGELPELEGTAISTEPVERMWETNQAMKDEIIDYEKSIVNKPIEHAKIYSSQGESGQVEITTSGTEGSISFTDRHLNILNELNEKGVDTILVHNHPAGSTLSMADLIMSTDTGLNEIRATTNRGRFRLILKDVTPTDVIKRGGLVDEFTLEKDSIYEAITKPIIEADRLNPELYSSTEWKRLFDEAFDTSTREAWKRLSERNSSLIQYVEEGL